VTTDAAGLTIGEFSRLTRLTAKALRIYDETGLLRPAAVDPSSGRRRYGAWQLRLAMLIRMLRGADMSLAEIGRLLAEFDQDVEQAVARLDRHLADLDARQASRRLLVSHIHAILREDDQPMFTVQTRHVPARRLMSIQRRLRAAELDSFVAAAKAEFAAHLHGKHPDGPFMLIFHSAIDNESEGPVEAALACAGDVAVTDVIGVRTEPAHDEAFTTITKAQWAYPAILAVYDAVACSAEATARPGSPLSCREVYLAEPEAVGDDEPICDVAFPLGPGGQARPDHR
jgi:DNA-binding transcriptional MerR regulator